MVEKTMREVTETLEAIPRSYGHIRFRSLIDDKDSGWSTELFGNAEPL